MSDDAAIAPPTTQVIDLRSVVDDQPINAYRLGVLFLILLAMFVDGYDLSAISFAGPLIVDDWGLDAGAMGSVFSIGLVGILIGGGVGALLGDWLGRRKLIIFSTFFCGVATFGTVWATDLPSLSLWRFLTGLGVGALSPVCLVMANEFAPARIRATVLACMFLGLTAGAQGASGLIAAKLAPTYGWEALFYTGGAISILAAVLLTFGLPESLKHLYVKRPDSPQIAKIAAKLRPGLAIGPDAVFTWRDEVRAEQKVPFSMLFSEGRWRITPTLWLVYFCAQMIGYALTLWLPTLLRRQGLSPETTAYAVALYAAFGLVGALTVSRFIDRYGVICHAVLPLVGIPLVVLVASIHGDWTLLVMAIALAGFSINGTLIGMSVIVGFFYPTAVRSTGVGLAIFVSRFGAILGPAVVGLLMSRTASIQTIFYASTVPLFIAAIGMFALGLLDRPRFTREKAAQSTT